MAFVATKQFLPGFLWFGAPLWFKKKTKKMAEDCHHLLFYRKTFLPLIKQDMWLDEATKLLTTIFSHKTSPKNFLYFCFSSSRTVLMRCELSYRCPRGMPSLKTSPLVTPADISSHRRKEKQAVFCAVLFLRPSGLSVLPRGKNTASSF